MSQDGLLVIDKPVGPTSHDVVARVRRILGEPRVGHTGTLDPMASGVLPLVLGRATRLVRFLEADDKCYDATVRLGFSTDTRDALGQMVGTRCDPPMPSREAIDRALDRFRGPFLQQPPAFSAKKIGGRRSYRLARAHARATALVVSPGPASSPQPLAPSPQSPAPSPQPPVPSPQPPVPSPQPPVPSPQPLAPPALPAPVAVTAESIDIVSAENDLVTLRISCSSGFYVRALAHDLGEALGTGAHLVALRRTRASGCTIEDAVRLDALEGDANGRDRAIAAVVPLQEMLPALPGIVLTDLGANRAARGCRLGAGDVTDGLTEASVATTPEYVRLVDGNGALVGVGERKASGLLHPIVVLV